MIGFVSPAPQTGASYKFPSPVRSCYAKEPVCALGLRRVVERRRDHLARVVYEPVDYHNTNRFTRERGWHIGLSKTGFIDESGHCLVMQTRIDQRNLVMVLLDAPTTWARIEDTERLRVCLQRHLGKRT